MGEFFGTDGIRGKAGEFPLDQRTIEKIGYALAKELKRRLGRAPHVIIGRDSRESGPMIEAALINGLRQFETTSESAGLITTPGVAYLTKILGADAGVVISASHNPYQDNGIKIFTASGRKLDDEAEESIERDLKDDWIGSFTGNDIAVEPDSRLTEKYYQYLKSEIGRELDLGGLRIVVDCANGASSKIAPGLFRSLGAEVTVINAEPDGRNINLESGSLHPERLQKIVSQTNADLGLAFDGDADRLLMVNSQGRLVDGDEILYLLARAMLEAEKLDGKRVVATVMSNLGLELALKKLGIELIRTSVGDKYVLDELLSGGGSLGGEQSGHIIFPKISLAGDGIITALEILRIVVGSKRTLAELAGDFKRFPQVLLNIDVSRKPELKSIPAIKSAMESIEDRFQGRGRLLVRYSGTENKARIMIEGEDQQIIQSEADSLAELIRRELG